MKRISRLVQWMGDLMFPDVRAYRQRPSSRSIRRDSNEAIQRLHAMRIKRLEERMRAAERRLDSRQTIRNAIGTVAERN